MQKVIPLVEITPEAKVKLIELLKEEDAIDSYLKIDVSKSSAGCGCGGGHKYVLELAQQVGPDELMEEIETIKIVTDKSSADILRGSKLDYRDTLQMTGFMIDNPNVQQGQGCNCGGD